MLDLAYLIVEPTSLCFMKPKVGAPSITVTFADHASSIKRHIQVERSIAQRLGIWIRIGDWRRHEAQSAAPGPNRTVSGCDGVWLLFRER